MTDIVRTVNPNCRWFHWIGQQLTTCDQCGKPIWEHEGITDPPKNPFGDEPFTGTAWKESDRWYRMHQRWLQGWEIEVEGATVHLREPQEPQPEPEPEISKTEEIEEKMVTIEPAVSVANIIFGITRDLSEEEMVEVIKMIDREMHSWEFTQAVFEHFKQEMKNFGK